MTRHSMFLLLRLVCRGLYSFGDLPGLGVTTCHQEPIGFQPLWLGRWFALLKVLPRFDRGTDVAIGRMRPVQSERVARTNLEQSSTKY